MKTVKNHDNNHQVIKRYIYNKEGKKIAVELNLAALEKFLKQIENNYNFQYSIEDLELGGESMTHEELMKFLKQK